MRDSVYKRFLLRGYFSSLELARAVRGMAGQPDYKLVASDYDKYWEHRPLMGVEPRFVIIGERVDAKSTCLDVGCGDGALLNFLSQKKQVEGLGLDISSVAVEKARARGIAAKVQHLEDFCGQNPSAQFDHVVISEVLEHVPNPENFVNLGWQLCRKTLWLTFPNIAYLPHRLRMLTGKFPVQWVVFPGEHLRFWSLPDFRYWLSRLEMPAPVFYHSNGIILFGLHKLWPNLLANQIVVRLDKR